jgi:hypothetical protein
MCEQIKTKLTSEVCHLENQMQKNQFERSPKVIF